MTLTDEKNNSVTSIFGQQRTALYFYEKDLIVIDGLYFTMYYVEDEITDDEDEITDMNKKQIKKCLNFICFT